MKRHHPTSHWLRRLLLRKDWIETAMEGALKGYARESKGSAESDPTPAEREVIPAPVERRTPSWA